MFDCMENECALQMPPKLIYQSQHSMLLNREQSHNNRPQIDIAPVHTLCPAELKPAWKNTLKLKINLGIRGKQFTYANH